MRHWQILKREDGIESICKRCIHFFTEESGEIDCERWLEPEWNDDTEEWECDLFLDVEEVDLRARAREEDLQVERAIEDWKGVSDDY